MSHELDVKKILVKIDTDKDFKNNYGIAFSMAPYVSYYDRLSIEKEVEKRCTLFSSNSTVIAQLTKDTMVTLDLIAKKINKPNYGNVQNIAYGNYNHTDTYRLLQDTCKGACLINSVSSADYDYMRKEFISRVVSILGRLNNCLTTSIGIESSLKSPSAEIQCLKDIVAGEVKYLTDHKNIAKTGETTVNYHGDVHKWKLKKIEADEIERKKQQAIIDAENRKNVRDMIIYAIIQKFEVNTEDKSYKLLINYSHLFSQKIIDTVDDIKKNDEYIEKLKEDPYLDVMEPFIKMLKKLNLDSSLGIDDSNIIQDYNDFKDNFKPFDFLNDVSYGLFKTMASDNLDVSEILSESKALLNKYNRLIRESGYIPLSNSDIGNILGKRHYEIMVANKKNQERNEKSDNKETSITKDTSKKELPEPDKKEAPKPEKKSFLERFKIW